MEYVGKTQLSPRDQPHTSKVRPRGINGIPVIAVPSQDLLLIAKAQSFNKLMGFHFCLRAPTGSVLLNTEANRSLSSDHFARLAKLSLGPSRARQIKVADERLLPNHQETMFFTIIMGTPTKTL